MRKPKHDTNFVESLLAQEKSVTEERYAKYRRSLAEKLAQNSGGGPVDRLTLFSFFRRRTVFPLLVGVAAVVLLALVMRYPWRTPPIKTSNVPEMPVQLVILRPAPAAWACGSSTPFFLENTSDVVAVGTLGDTFEHDKEQLVRLQVERVLKGKLVRDDVSTPVPAPERLYGCPVPAVPPIPPRMYRKGTRVLLYLTHSKQAGLQVLKLNPLSKQQEKNYVPQIERFALVCQAGCSANPKQAFQQCLAPEAGGFDVPACWALAHRPHAEGAAVVLTKLESLRKQIGGKPKASKNELTTMRNLVSTLKKMPRSKFQQQILNLYNAPAQLWFRNELKPLLAQ